MSALRPDGRSFGRYIGMQLREVDDGSGSPIIEAGAPVNDLVRGSGGGMSAGALLTLADVGPIRARARVLRVGRRSGVVTGIEMRDEGNADALVGEAVLTSAALEPPEGMPLPNRPIAIDPGPPPELEGSLRDALGIYAVDPPDGYDAAVRLDVIDDVRNPWGIVHGGAIAVLVDAVADAAQAGALTEVVVHFLRPGRVGPIEARARIVGPDAGPIRVDLVDAGADREVALASARSA